MNTTRKKSSGVGWRHALRGWVQGLVLSAAEMFRGDVFEVALLTTDTDEAVRVDFEEASPREARDRLERIVADFWFDPHEYRLALSEVSEVVGENLGVDPDELRREVWSADERRYGGSRDAYGPVANVERYDIPDCDAAGLTALLERRMGPFVCGALRSDL